MTKAKAKKKFKKKAKKQSSAAGGATELRVCLHTMANPPVFISDREKQTSGGSMIVWKPVPGAPNFSFETFFSSDAAFVNPLVKNNKVTCDFAPPSSDPPGTKYEYTITVKKAGDSYSSDEVVTGPTGGRAVIRN